MLKEINQERKVLREKISQKEHLEKRLGEMNNDLLDAQSVLKQYEQQLQNEKRDVSRLKSMSLYNVFYTLTGQKEEQLSKEELEELKAKKMLDRKTLEATMMEEEITSLENRLRQINDDQVRYDRLLEDKKKLLKEMDHETLEALVALEDSIAKKEQTLVELNEAIAAASDATDALYRAREVLKSARNWGTVDLLSKRSLIASWIKQEKAKDAEQLMMNANHALRRFDQELKDVSLVFDWALHFTPMVRTFDIWLDNIFTDVHVQGKIKEALRSVISSLSNVQDAKEDVEKEYRNVKQKLEEEQAMLDSLVKEAK